MKPTKTYFFRSFLTILISVCVFFLLKQLLPDKIFPEVSVKSNNIVVDSLMILALTEENDTPTTIQIKDTVLTIADEKQGQEITSSLQEETKATGMDHFFKKLYQLERTKKGRVRVAYFGDSMTEGDLIVQDIRKNYQAKYGGEGVGFIPISLLTPPQSISLKHDYSENWITYSFLKKSPVPVGVSGFTSFAPDSTGNWVHFHAGSCPLTQSSLLYGKSENDSAFLQIISGGDTLSPVRLHPDKDLNTVAINSVNNDLLIKFHHTDSIPFYGINFASRQGVYIDNFSTRGNSGLPLSVFNIPLMKAFQKELQYDLIVLQYGTNVLNSKRKDYGWYAKRMTTTVNHLKRCFPEASILIASVADKSAKYGTEMKTDSAIIPLIESQKAYASGTGSGFLNLFELMGGEGSMVEWVEQDPPLAAKDYTHLSSKGAKKMADLIFKELEKEYEAFKTEQELSDSVNNVQDDQEQNENK